MQVFKCFIQYSLLLCRTGMAGVPGTASTIFSTVKDVGANVIMISQVSPNFSVCLSGSVLFIIFLLIISLDSG